MADTKNNITTSFKVDISNLKSGISEANRQIKLANAEFKAAASSLDFMADSADGIRTKLDQLTKVLDAQESILSAYEKQLELTVKEQGEGSKAADDLRIKIANQQAAINDTKKQLKEYNDKLDDAENGMEDGAKAADDLGDNMEQAGKDAKDASKGFTVMKGVLADLAATAIKAVVSGLKDMGKAAIDAYKSFDKGADNIIKATGATGEEAQELKKAYANVSKSIVADAEDIGDAMGDVNTRFGFTGSELEKATTKFLKFSEITGSDAVSSIDAVARAIESAGLSYNDYGKLLDEIAKASQASGVSVDKVADGLTKYGAQMRALGFDTEDTIAMFAQWEKAGVNTESVFAGLSKAAMNWSKEGKDAKTEFAKLLADIKKAPNATKAAEIATKKLGKAGLELADAAYSGRLDFADFAKAIKASGGTVDDTFEATQDATDKFELAMQGLKTEVAQVIGELLDKYGADIEKAIQGITQLLSALIPKVAEIIGFIVDHWQIIGALAGTIAAVFTAIKVGTAVTAAFNAVLAANPITLIVLAIAALVAAIIGLVTHFEEFTAFFAGIWETIKEIAQTAIDAIVGFFQAGWEAIKIAWSAVTDFFAGIWDGIKKAFSAVGDWFKGIFQGAWDGIKNIWSNVIIFFSSLWSKIQSIFDGVGNFFRGVFEGAKNIVSNIIDAMVNVIKTPINWIIKGINGFIWGLNHIKIPDWIPGVGGYGINIGYLSELKRGGVLERGQVGLLEGDGAEAVVPLENNKAWISATAEAMKQALQSEGVLGGSAAAAGQNITFNQYNTSPKALSRLDIYRNTQNQLNYAKGAL
ncbi:MAG: phage tail tape measure protein [Alphaproteobacteria bacterium]|nr:phage tail tape measure protein [Alphaproteobacteria bacterium]